jgi:Kae1-associated kinase Bud32
VELTNKGAEADLFLDGGRIVKVRVPKAYRIPVLDARLRKQRTKRESRNLERAAEALIKVPKLIRTDEKNATVEMEYVEGPTLKALFDLGERVEELSVEFGRILRRLHEAGIVHNDLTTSNLILSTDGICMIDFGLAYHSDRLEDKAMDLVVFKKSIQASHTLLAGRIWGGLTEGYKPGKDLLGRVETIECRVRYK